MAGPRPRTLIIDQFLEPDLLRDLLDYTLRSEDRFISSRVNDEGVDGVQQQHRIALTCKDALGPLTSRFEAVAMARFEELCRGTGVPVFDVAKLELELAAHGDGAFYLPHLDTITGRGRSVKNTDRILTGVFYFHREPQAFSGGNLGVHPLGGGAICDEIEPRQNRIAAFASFVLHQVLPVSVPSGKFADYRFAVNVWYRRAQ